MYEFIKGLHNVLRWLVLLGGVSAVIVTLRGLFTRAVWGDLERRLGSMFAGLLDLQIVLGLLLYFISPLTAGNFGNMGSVMANDELRFFLVEHLVIMILAAVAAHVGVAAARRADSDRTRFVRSSIAFLLAMALILYGIPWDRAFLPGV